MGRLYIRLFVLLCVLVTLPRFSYAVGEGVFADFPTGVGPQQVPVQTGTGVDYYNIPATDLLCNKLTMSCPLATDIPRCGSQIGAAGCFRGSSDGGIDARGTVIQVTQGNTPDTQLCDAAGEIGRPHYETDNLVDPELWCSGANGWRSYATRLHITGGNGSDGAFSQTPGNGGAGCNAADCDDSCTTCTGTEPNCECVLPANSLRGRVNTDSGTTMYSCEYNFTTFTLSGGTVTCGQENAYGTTGAPTVGASLIIRVMNSPVITGGTIEMTGKGAAGGTAGGDTGVASARNGGNGGWTSFYTGAAGGNGTTPTAPTAGIQAPSNPKILPFYLPITIGTGGGGGAGSGTPNAIAGFGAAQFTHEGSNYLGSTGGGGGYCQATAGDTAQGGVGGRGGGEIIFETAGVWSCTNLTFNTVASNGANGTNAGAGGGGGGGGGITIFARQFGTETNCTYTRTGGSGGAIGTNCSVGATGADGQLWKFAVPF